MPSVIQLRFAGAPLVGRNGFRGRNCLVWAVQREMYKSIQVWDVLELRRQKPALGGVAYAK